MLCQAPGDAAGVHGSDGSGSASGAGQKKSADMCMVWVHEASCNCHGHLNARALHAAAVPRSLSSHHFSTLFCHHMAHLIYRSRSLDAMHPRCQ